MQKLLFFETVYSFNLFLESISQIRLHTPTLIYCCSTFPCLLTTLSVINNVNMSFFLNKDFKKIASNEVLSQRFLLWRDGLQWDCGNIV